MIADSQSTGGFTEEAFANTIFKRILKRLNEGVRFCPNPIAVLLAYVLPAALLANALSSYIVARPTRQTRTWSANPRSSAARAML